MLRTMVFIDYENFDIAYHNYCKKSANDDGHSAPWLDMIKLPTQITKAVSTDYQLIKTFLFVPEPDDFLKAEPWRKKKFDWLKGLESRNHLTVITGRHVSRPIAGRPSSTKDITSPESYYIEEKGTDINIAVHLLTKAFHNAFDVAIIVSGDSDYVPVYDILNTIGKTVIVAGVKGQNLTTLKSHSDKQFIINESLLKACKLKLKSDTAK